MNTFKRDTSHSVEITQSAARAIIGNDEKTWHDFEKIEIAEMTTFQAHGVFIFAIHNFIAGVTQYYLQDVNV